MNPFDDFIETGAEPVTPETVAPDQNKSPFDDFIPPDTVTPSLNRSLAVVDASGVTPDQAAEARMLARELGVPAGAIEPNLPAVKKQVEDKRIINAVKNDPNLARFMSDPNFAKIGKDDIDGLTMVTDRFRALVGGGVISPIGSSLSGAGELNAIAARGIERGIVGGLRGVGLPGAADTAQSVLRSEIPWWLDPTQIIGRPGQAVEKAGQAVDVPADRRIDYVDDAISGAGQVATQMATMLVTGGAGMMAMAGTQAIDQQADRARDAGSYGTASADAGAMLAAPVTAVMEKFGLDKIMQRAPLPIRNAVARNIADIFASGGIEAAQEVVEGITQNIITQQFVNPDQQIFEGMDNDAAGGFGGGAFGRFLLLAATRGKAVRERSEAAKETAEKQEAFNQVVEATNASKVNLRDKDAFKEFVSGLKEGGEIDNVYIPAEKLEQYFQSSGFTPEQVGLTQAEIDSAIASDGDIAIPVENYLADIAPEHHGSLADFIRLTESSMTAEEAKNYADSIEEIATEEQARIREDIEREIGSREPFERVQADLMQQLKTAGFADDVAKQYAALNASLYATAADRLGGDAFERYQADAPRIVREIQGRELGKRITNLEMQVADAREYFKKKDASSRRTAGQKVADMFGVKKEKKEKSHPRPILRYLESRGGVDPNGRIAAELKAMDITPKNTPRLFRTTGLGSLDNIPASEFDAEMADFGAVAQTDENGYVSEAFFLEMLREESAGNYLKTQAERDREAQVEVYEELRDVLGRADLDIETASIEEIRAALGAYQESYRDPDGVTYNQDGALKTDTEAFKKWFGDSKVVDENGKPLVVYHGTAKGGYVETTDFESFDPEKTGDRWNADSRGFFFTNDTRVSNYYTTSDLDTSFRGSPGAGRGAVYPVYVSLQNPLIVNVDADQDIVSHWDEHQDKLQKKADAGGHDGVIVRDPSQDINGNPAMNVIAFRPEQIKSIFNRGTFDANDPRILYQSAFHGSPHKFDKFTLDNIGGGEGAQAFGWGLYFAGDKQIAEFYRKNLSGEIFKRADGKSFDPSNDLYHVNVRAVLNKVLRQTSDINAAVEAAKERAKKAMDGSTPGEQAYDYAASDLKTMEDATKSGALVQDSGQLYEVNIPEDDVLLDWDKPLSEQPEFVRNAIYASGYTSEADGLTGEQIYKDTSDYLRGGPETENPDELTSKLFNSLGIKGIRYLDANSRLKKDGKHNYVIFDDTAIETIKTYYQGQQEGPRGSYTPSENLIRLFEGSNLSTFIHESGHMWLERMRGWSAEAEALLERPDLEPERVAKLQEVIDDYQKILKHIGNDGSGDLTREQHELFARTVEAYAMEGKAPSVELQPAFERFKTWLLRIYETVKTLRVNMNPEIRGVLDRMLATDMQIAEAERIAQYEYLDIPDATPEERMRLNRLQEAATGEADSQLLQKMMEPVRRQKEKWWKEEFRAMSDTVRAEIEARPEWRALRLAQGDENIDPVKLDLKMLEDKFGSGIRSLLPRGVTTKQGGVNPDEMAELVGLLNAQELVELLGGIRGVSINQLVRQEAQARMDEKYGDVLNDGTIEKEAADAVRNSKRADHIAMELKTLRRLGAEKEARKVAERRVAREGAFDPQAYASEAAVAETGAERLIAQETQRAARFIRSVDRAGRAEMERAMSDINPKAIRNAARKVIGQLKNKDLTKTAQYARGELKAADLARKAIAKRDYEQAAFYKYRQLLNHYLYIEAKAAQKEMDTAVKYLGGLAGKKMIPAMDQEYLDQIHGLLEKFDFRRASQAEVERRRSFAEWAAEQEAMGRDIVAPDSLIQKSQTTHYSQVTLNDLRGLKDTVKQIDGLGRLKQKLLDGQKEREFNEVVTEAVDSIYDNNERIAQLVNQNMSRWDELKSAMRSADASLLKMEQVFDWLDGGKPGVFSRVFKRFSDAQARENDLTVQYNKQLNEILDTLDSKRMQDSIRISGYVNKDGVEVIWKRSDLIAVMLNLGNQDNLDRLMDRNGNNLSEMNIKEITTHLNKAELEAVNKIWELVDTMWPEIEAMEKRVNKVAPPKVEATPFDIQLPSGEVVAMRGGYYPIIYDPLRSIKASQYAEQDTSKRYFEGNYVKASTIKNHTKERMANVGRPIELKLELVSRHFGQVIHDLTHREAIIESDRLLSDKRIQDAVNNVLGREYSKTFRGWLHSIAGDRNIDPNSLETWAKAASTFRTNMSVMGMGFRMTTMISQVAGFSGGAEMIGAKWVGVGMKEFYKNPANISTVLDEVRAKSGEMRHRHNNIDRDIRDGIRKLERDSTISDIQRLAFAGISIIDAGVSGPIWIGAYQKGLSEKLSDADAVAYADKVVRLSQSAAGAKDLSVIQRGKGNEFFKLFTMFYSYFNAMYARQRDMGRSFKKDGDYNELFMRSLYLLVIPSIGTQLLTGRGPGEDEEPGTWALLNLLTYPFASIPMLRDIMSAFESGYGYSVTPVARGGESILKLGKNIGKIATGEDVDAQRVAGQALDVLGFTVGLPTGQVKTTGNYIWDVIDGDQRPDGVLEFLRGVTLGPEKK